MLIGGRHIWIRFMGVTVPIEYVVDFGEEAKGIPGFNWITQGGQVPVDKNREKNRDRLAIRTPDESRLAFLPDKWSLIAHDPPVEYPLVRLQSDWIASLLRDDWPPFSWRLRGVG